MTIFPRRISTIFGILFILSLFAGCGGGGGGGVDEDVEQEQWGSPGTGKGGIPIFWTRLGGNAYSGSASIVETPSHDGFVAAGFRQADNAPASTGTVVKVDNTGSIVWEKEFSDQGYSIVLNCIRKTSNGGYVAAGWRRSATSNTDLGTFLVLRLDANGNALSGWPKTYETTYSSGATSICESKDGLGNPDGFVFTGAVQNTSHNDIVSFIQKIDLNGDVQWRKTYDPPLMFGTDVATSVVPDDNQGFLVAGAEGNERLYGYDELSDRIWVDRIGADGSSLEGWPKYYGTGAPASVKKTSDGGFILAGNSFSVRASKYTDALVIKVNAQGVREWSKTFGLSNAQDGASDVDLCTDQGYIITGGTDSYDPSGSNPSSEVFLMRLDPEGNSLWKKVKGRAPDSSEGASGVVAASDGGFAVSGGAAGSFMVAKFDSDGDTITLGEKDYSTTVTGTTGIINSLNALSLAGRSVNSVSQSVLIGGFGLDTLIKVRDNPALNGTGGLSISPAPTSIPAGGPYVITMNNYSTTYGDAAIRLTGSMTILITSCSPGTITTGGTYTAEATMWAVDVTVTDSEDLETSFAGRFLFRRESTSTTLAERASNDTGSPGSTLSITGDDATLTMSVFSNFRSMNMTSGVYNIYTVNTMLYQVSGITGNFSFSLWPPIAGTDPMSPGSGNAEITAQDDSKVDVAITSCGSVKLEVDTDADGTTDSIINTTFDNLY